MFRRSLTRVLLLLVATFASAACGSGQNEGDEGASGADNAYSIAGIESELVDGVWVFHRPSETGLAALYQGEITVSPNGCMLMQDGTPVVFNSVLLDDARGYAQRLADGKTPSIEIGGGYVPIGGAIPIDDFPAEFNDHCMPADPSG